MSNKFNANALTEYSRSYARRITNDFYQQHTVISGKQILNLTPIGQINLFVVNSLFEKWKADAEKFRSPYFDFTHPEVEEALKSFMNVVSQHIAVRREHLEPILADAVRRTLCLLFDPRGYFDEILRELPEFTLTSLGARQLVRFTQIHKIIPVTIEQRMNGKSFIYANQALGYLDEVLAQQNHELDRYDKYLPLFAATMPLDLSALLRAHVPDSIINGPTRSFFDDSLDHQESPTIPAILSINQPVDAEMVTDRLQTIRPVYEPKATYNTSSSNSDEETRGIHLLTDRDTGPEPIAPITQPIQPISTPINVGVDVVNESESSPVWSPVATESSHPESATLNDRLRESAAVSAERTDVSVAEAFHRAPIESVGKSISLNQKFRFINQLFNGNSSAYAQVIEELDTMSNYGQALDLISYRYASQYMWDMSSDEVSELVEILKRRFA